jgi:outer membrane autotransporter protein
VDGNATGGIDGVVAQTASGNNAVTVGAAATGGSGEGVFVQGLSGNDAVTVGGNATGGTDGVFALTTTGNNTVTVGGNATGGSGAGVLADTTTGNDVVTAEGNATGGIDGVFAQTASGNNTVTVGGSATGASGDGVFAETATGNNTIMVGGDATGAEDGVFAVTTTGNNVVSADGNATGGIDGVFAQTSIGNNRITVGGSATGASGDGVFAETATGNNTVMVGGDATGADDGVFATTGTGNNTVTVNSAAGGSANGVEAVAATGNNIVTTTGVVSGATFGVLADTTTGNNVVTVANASGGTVGVYAASVTGDNTVTVGDASGGAIGVEAATTNGNNTVTTSGGVSGGGFGVSAVTTNGDNTVTASGTVSGGTWGVSAYTTTGDNTVTTSGAVSGGSFGVAAETTTGNNAVTTGGAVTAGAVGVLADATNGNDVVTVNGTVTVSNSKDATGIQSTAGGASTVDIATGSAVEVAGNVAFGVVALAAGNATVTLGGAGAGGGIVVTGAATGSGSFGVEAIAGGNATVTTGSMQITVTGGVGIAASGTTVSVITGGNVDATSFGIETDSSVAASVDVSAGTLMAGNAFTPAIGFTNAAGGATTTVTIASGATVENSVGGAAGLAIAAFSGAGNSTGSVAVNDWGTLFGDVNFSMLQASKGNVSDVTVNVLAGGLWVTRGTDVFGLGNATTNDTLSNAGTIQTTGDTTFQFGNASGGSNTISNGGTLAVGADGAPATLTIAGTTTFSDSGVIDLTGGPAGTDAVNAPGTAFVGAGGMIKTNVNLSTEAANSLTVGSTSGTDSILVNATGVGSHATVANPIVLVTASGANGGTFTLAPGSTGFTNFGGGAVALVRGPWIYTLDNNVPVSGTNDTVLLSSPGPLAFQGPVLAAAAETIWYGAGPWEDRQADLRDSSLLTPGSLGSFTPGVWIQGFGDWADRSDRIDPPAGFVFNLGYHQDTYGLSAGVDAAKDVGAGVGLIGVTAGYLHSNVDFASNMVPDSSFEGWTAAVYATYIQDPFFLNAEIKGDFLELKANGAMGSVAVDSWGGQIDSGYRFPLGGSMTLEPFATLAYVSTDLGSTIVAGTTFRFGDQESFRGALGLRLSAPVVSNDSYRVTLAVDGRIWDEFDGNSHVTLISGGPPVEAEDNFSGTFGDMGAGLNIYSHDGRSSGFVRASYKFKDDYDEGAVSVGYRYQWGAPPPPPPPP